MKFILGSILSIIMFTSTAYPGWKEHRSKLREMYKIDEFRIFYNLSGEDALPQEKQSDKNENGYPDYVEDIGMKLVSARNFFDIQVGLTHPLKSDRYNDKAEFIDINLLNMPLKSGGARNGIAYDGMSSFDRVRDKGVVKVLAVDLSNNLSPDNSTPGHELFHLYQNGYTMFKNRWYTEGTARWSEKILQNSLGKRSKLPSSRSEVKHLINKSYKASGFWNTICNKVDARSKGKVFMKAFLEELQQMDDIASRDRGLEAYNWKESVQKGPENNFYIWQAFIKTLERPEFKPNWDKEIEKLAKIRI